MYTEWPAHASFQENFRGKIKQGFRADFSVLSQNLSSIHSEEILSTKVLFTIVNGKLVYSS
jgi:predicted amidohydrolase YtcJ